MGRFKKQDGFSLLEVVIAFAIMMMVMALSFSFFMSSSDIFRSGVGSSTTQNNMQLAVFTVSQQVKLATDVAVVSDPPSLPDGEYGYFFLLEDPDTEKWALAYMSPSHPPVAKTEYVMAGSSGPFAILQDDQGFYLRQTYASATTSYDLVKDTALLNVPESTPIAAGTAIRFKP